MKSDDPILQAAKASLLQHHWGNFDESKSSDRKLITVGCVPCKRTLVSMTHFQQHLADDVLPGILDEVLERTALSES